MTEERETHGELPSGWAEVPLADIASNRSGNSKLIKGKLFSEPTPEAPYPGFSASGQDVWLKTYDNEGKAVIVSAVGARCGKAFEADGKWSAIANTHIVRPNLALVDPKLFWYLINDEKFWVKGGSAQPFVKVNKTFERLFRLPPLAEQKRIADKLEAVLGRVDACRARLDRVPALLKRFRQSVLAAAASGKLTEEWRATGSSYSESLVEYPYSHAVVGAAGWQLTTFGDLCSLIGGSQPPKSTFTHDESPSVIRLIQIRDYKSDRHKVFIPRNLARRFCSVHDVMIGRYGPPIFQILRGIEGAYNVALMKAEPQSAKLDQNYLYYWLKQDVLLRYVEAGSDRTAGQDGVRKELVERYPFFLPPVEEQQEIVRRIEALFAFADRIEARLATARKTVERLTPATLAKAFRGELVPQDPADEPASALLERLHAQSDPAAAKPKRGRRAKSTSD